MKICILTQPLHTNYGGLLQAYALQRILKELGHEVVTVRDGVTRKRLPIALPYFLFHLYKRCIKGDRRFNPYQFMLRRCGRAIEQEQNCVAQHCNRFVEEHISTIELFSSGSVSPREEVSRYDAIVVGSDQVWRREYSDIETYFLDFAEGLPLKRIAYAASFGSYTLEGYSPQLIARCRTLAAQFSAISLREQSGVSLVEENFGVSAQQVLDPALLLDSSHYARLTEKREPLPQGRMMSYILDKGASSEALERKVGSLLSLAPHRVMPPRLYHQEWSSIEECVFPPVEEWINGFKGAEFVVTNSFHGVLFSIIFNKPFIALDNSQRGSARFDSILRLTGLESRLVRSSDEITRELLLSHIDFAKVNSIINRERESSIEWLKESLKG